MTDDLLRPTVTAPPSGAKPPWRIHSQFWVAFFGGPMPAAVIAYLNARRLRLGQRERMQIVFAGAVSLVMLLVAVYFVPELAASIRMQERPTARLAIRLIGVLLYLVLAKIQSPADRLRNLGNDERYDSLWIAGITAILVLGILQGMLGAAVRMLLR